MEIKKQELELIVKMKTSENNRIYIMDKKGRSCNKGKKRPVPYREGDIIEKELQDLLDGMVEKGWIEDVTDDYISYRLTEKGIEAYEQHIGTID
ncbi:hypothetical protein KY343_02480 [Candidatus Woesearchaeota archaeon]|nr:hypothetical protein [Candidatus Woesearchaeota archaeon]